MRFEIPGMDMTEMVLEYEPGVVGGSALTDGAVQVDGLVPERPIPLA